MIRKIVQKLFELFLWFLIIGFVVICFWGLTEMGRKTEMGCSSMPTMPTECE